MASVFGFIPPRPEVWGGGGEGREGRRDGERRRSRGRGGRRREAKRQCKRGN